MFKDQCRVGLRWICTAIVVLVLPKMTSSSCKGEKQFQRSSISEIAKF